MIDSGILTDKIVPIYPVEVERDIYGHTKTEWHEGRPMAAKVTWTRSDRAVLEGSEYMSGVIGVTTRWRKELTGRCRVKWQGHVFALDGDPMGSYQSERMDFTATRLDDAAR